MNGMRIHAISDLLTIKKNNIDDSGVGEFIFHDSARPACEKLFSDVVFPPPSDRKKTEREAFKHSAKAHQSMNKISSNDERSYELPAVTVIGIYGESFCAAVADTVRHCARANFDLNFARTARRLLR